MFDKRGRCKKILGKEVSIYLHNHLSEGRRAAPTATNKKQKLIGFVPGELQNLWSRI